MVGVAASAGARTAPLVKVFLLLLFSCCRWLILIQQVTGFKKIIFTQVFPQI
jgi:hypothetical protein